MSKIYLIIGLILFVSVGAGALYLSRGDDFVCPNDYKTYNDYVMGRAQWLNEQMIKNPTISEQELVEKARNKSEEHHCSRASWLL